MKITIPDGIKAQIIHSICKFINYADEGVYVIGTEYSLEDGKNIISGVKAIIEYLVLSNKKLSILLGGSAADKQLVSDALLLVEEYITTECNDRSFEAKINQILHSQTFVATPFSVSIADYALFFVASLHLATFAPFNGYVDLVRWYSYMQDYTVDACKDLNIARIEFNYDVINIHAIAKPSESKKSKKEVKKEEVKKEEVKKEVAGEDDVDVISKLDIRVGRIVRAWNHPDSEKLFCEEVDVGEAETRQIGSGIRAFHTFEEMQGHRVCVLCNLKPRKLGGFLSNGMLMCASTDDHEMGALIDPPADAKIGERVIFPGHEGDAATAAQVQKKKYLETALPLLKTNAEGVCCFMDVPFTTSAGVVVCEKFPNNHIS